MYQKLQFRRQFLLTEAEIIKLTDWNCLRIDQYYLYVHSDLEVNEVRDSAKTIVLLGDLYDSEEPEKNNLEILKDILVNS